jgi:hypothetical protein
MPTVTEIQMLIDQADLAGNTGDVDREIELRTHAFLLSEGMDRRPTEEIEKAG